MVCDKICPGVVLTSSLICYDQSPSSLVAEALGEGNDDK